MNEAVNEAKVGFLGFGNMAQAIARGLLFKKAIPANQIYAYDILQENLHAACQQLGTNACPSAINLTENADIIVIAVKPHLVAGVVEPLKKQLKGKILLSIAAGIYFNDYQQMLLPGTHHISTVPNTPVSVGEGIIICESRHNLTDEEYELLRAIFSPIGRMVELDSKQFSVGGTLSGCGPAFAAMFIEALADGAVKNGLPRPLAYELASQMLAGTAKLQLETGAHPGVIKDTVCSPGGTTIVGVSTLERSAFRSAVIDAIDAIEHK